jgi:hypothetical protein
VSNQSRSSYFFLAFAKLRKPEIPKHEKSQKLLGICAIRICIHNIGSCSLSSLKIASKSSVTFLIVKFDFHEHDYFCVSRFFLQQQLQVVAVVVVVVVAAAAAAAIEVVATLVLCFLSYLI